MWAVNEFTTIIRDSERKFILLSNTGQGTKVGFPF